MLPTGLRLQLCGSQKPKACLRLLPRGAHPPLLACDPLPAWGQAQEELCCAQPQWNALQSCTLLNIVVQLTQTTPLCLSQAPTAICATEPTHRNSASGASSFPSANDLTLEGHSKCWQQKEAAYPRSASAHLSAQHMLFLSFSLIAQHKTRTTDAVEKKRQGHPSPEARWAAGQLRWAVPAGSLLGLHISAMHFGFLFCHLRDAHRRAAVPPKD